MSYGSDAYLRDESRLTGKTIASFWTEQEQLYRHSYEKIEAARSLLAGETKAPLPSEIHTSNPEAFRVSLPQKYTTPIKLQNKLSEAIPEVKRSPVSPGPRALDVATKIEQNANAYMTRLYPYAATIDLLLNEGECAVICAPTMAAWQKTPQLYEDGTRRVKKRYRRDAEGRAPDDERYVNGAEKFRPNLRESTKAFASEEMHYLAQHPPFEFRVLSRLNMMPVNPRFVGNRVQVDGLVIKTNYTVSELIKRRYRWGASGMLQAGERNAGRLTDELSLYEYWGTYYDESDDSDHVYVSYCVDGHDTWRLSKDGEQEPAVLDLTELYGLTTLPIAYSYGWHFPGVVDPDKRGIPFVDPFARTWLNMETIGTAESYRYWSTAFLTMVYKPDPQLIEWAQVEFGELPTLDMHPLKIPPILGDLVPVRPASGGSDATQLMALLAQSIRDEAPPPGAFGGGAVSAPGYARNVLEKDVLGTVAQITRGALNLFQESASNALEIATLIGRKYRPVVIEHEGGTIVTQTGTQSAMRATLELDPDLCGDDYTLKAIIAPNFGENLAVNQLAAEWRDRGILPTRKVLEMVGDPAPEQTLAEVDAEAIGKLPQFQMRAIARALKLVGDEELADEIMAELEPGPDGKPVPAGFDAGVTVPGMEMPPGQPPMAPQGGNMTGMAMPNIAASSLGGRISGEMQAGAMADQGTEIQ